MLARLLPRLRAAAIVAPAALLGCATRAPAPAMPAGIELRLTALPDDTPADAAIHVAGTFNDWNPGAPAFRLRRGADGTWAITLPDSIRGAIEFKFTLGSWDAVEATAGGADVANRRHDPARDGRAWSGTVAAWRRGPRPPKPSTARATVSVLDTAFAMPQLGRTRRIVLYLPPDYATSGRRYPVIYMQDGQNVFDDSTSNFGEWGIDETLDSLHALGDPGAIVVAVDHGGRRRGDEYHPWPSARFGGGEGDRYLDFLARTLKPWIDARYRTIPGPEGTAIVGSSSGGLIAFHAYLRHPGVFGRIGAFSPAFVVSDSVFALARAARPPAGTRLYMVSGLKETVAGQPDDVFSGRQRRMLDTLLAAGWRAEDVRSLLPADGTHAEWFWRREFPAAYRWLFARDR